MRGDNMPEREGDRVVETAIEARAGVTGKGGRYVLAVSTIVAAIVMAGLFLYFFW